MSVNDATDITQTRAAHERLVAVRKARSLSQVQLSTAAGVGLASIQRLERGDRSVSWGTAAKVASALGVDPTTIYNGDDMPRDLREATGPVMPSWFALAHAETQAKLDHILRELETTRSP